MMSVKEIFKPLLETFAENELCFECCECGGDKPCEVCRGNKYKSAAA